jgi:hypothetical protein
MKEGCKNFKAYLIDLEELFVSCCEVMQQGTVLQDTTPIIFNKPEVTPEVRSDPLPSHSDIQVMINYVLERQAKSIDELLCRLIEERDGKKLEATSANSSSTCTISFTVIPDFYGKTKYSSYA